MSKEMNLDVTTNLTNTVVWAQEEERGIPDACGERYDSNGNVLPQETVYFKDPEGRRIQATIVDVGRKDRTFFYLKGTLYSIEGALSEGSAVMVIEETTQS